MVINLDRMSFKMTPPTFLSDITFLSFENVKRTYAKLSDITFLSSENVKRTYAKRNKMKQGVKKTKPNMRGKYDA